MLDARHTSTVCARVRVPDARIPAHEGASTCGQENHAREQAPAGAGCEGTEEIRDRLRPARDPEHFSGKIAGGERSPESYDRSNSVVSKKGESARPNIAIHNDPVGLEWAAKSLLSCLVSQSIQKIRMSPVNHAVRKRHVRIGRHPRRVNREDEANTDGTRGWRMH